MLEGELEQLERDLAGLSLGRDEGEEEAGEEEEMMSLEEYEAAVDAGEVWGLG